MARESSPTFGGSTLTTCAPISASKSAAYGPASTRVRSTTMMPDRGPSVMSTIMSTVELVRVDHGCILFMEHLYARLLGFRRAELDAVRSRLLVFASAHLALPGAPEIDDLSHSPARAGARGHLPTRSS